jgi:hypothetical protein
MQVEAVVVAVFVAVFVKAALDVLARTIREAVGRPELELRWLALVAIGGGAALAWVLKLNVFAFLGEPWVGRGLTALAVGLGADFLNDMLAIPQGRRVTAAGVRGVNVKRGSRAGW